MDDELWTTDRQTEQLRSVRADGQAVWSDSAAREVGTRWLDPHDALAGRVVDASRRQSGALATARREQAEAEAEAEVALARAADVVGWVARVEEGVARCGEACAHADDAAGRADRARGLAQDATRRARHALDRAR